MDPGDGVGGVCVVVSTGDVGAGVVSAGVGTVSVGSGATTTGRTSGAGVGTTAGTFDGSGFVEGDPVTDSVCAAGDFSGVVG